MAQERRRPEPHPWNIISRVSPSFSWLAGAKRQRERERERERKRKRKQTKQHRHVKKHSLEAQSESLRPRKERTASSLVFIYQRQVPGHGFIFPCDHPSLIPLTHRPKQSIDCFSLPITNTYHSNDSIRSRSYRHNSTDLGPPRQLLIELVYIRLCLRPSRTLDSTNPSAF
jgi:hypothetical protein